MPTYMGQGRGSNVFSDNDPWAQASSRDQRPGNRSGPMVGRRGGGEDFLDRLAQAEQRDSHRAQGPDPWQQQAMQQQQMQMQMQREQQMKREQAMMAQRQKQAMQMQHQQAMQQQQMQIQMQRQQTPHRSQSPRAQIQQKHQATSFSLGSETWSASMPSPRGTGSQMKNRRVASPRHGAPSPRAQIQQKNQMTSFSLGADVWDSGMASPRGGGGGPMKNRQSVTPKACGPARGSSPRGRPSPQGPAAGGYRRLDVNNQPEHRATRPATPGGVSTISLGSTCWDGSATSPRGSKPLRQHTPSYAHHTMPRTGMSPRAAGCAMSSYDHRPQIGSNVVFG